MARNKRISKVLSLLITMIMVLGCLTPFVYAEGNDFSSAKVDLQKEALNKIMPEVSVDLEKDDMVEILVYMEEQVNTEMVAEATRKAISTSMTPYNTKLTVRKGVVEALRDKAEISQINLLKYLEQEKEKGNVEEFESYHIVNMIYVKATKEVVENISYMPEIGKIYKNKTHKMDFPKMEGEIEQNTDGVEWNIERVRADEAWGLGVDGTGAVVGSLDSGVDWTHPALKNKWRGYDPNTGETNPEGNWFDPVYDAQLPADSDSHGTHVMGTAVGQEADGSNKVGVAPGAKWIAARVFNAAGSTTDRILLDAAQWMAAPAGNPDNAPDVVNNSWGGLDGIDNWYMDAVDNWRAAEILPVFSAGNQRLGEPAPWPGSISVPSNYPQSFAVAATDRNDIRASFSKLGPSPYDESLIKPNISAPGVGIRSCIPGNGYTGAYSGTSMSAPHISGTAALLMSANSALTVEDLEIIMQDTARGLTDSTYPQTPNFGYGYGMVDAFEAVSSVASGTGYISGKVLQDGEDLEDAVIVHEQEVFETYMGSDIDIIAEISDDIAVTEVELLVKQQGKSYWLLVPMNRISGDHKNGTYMGTISYDMLIGNSLIYKIRARDYAGEGVVTEDHKIGIKFGILPDEYEMGFESNPIGWIFDGSWAWGQPTGNSPEPYEGENVAGTNINGDYSNRADDWLVTPPIDLRDENLGSATLRFHEWYETENNYDKGYLLITNDYGENWTEVRPIITGNGKEWNETIVNLGDYIGSETPVYLAFRLTSDGSGTKAGWFIDNVRLIGADREPPKDEETGFISLPKMEKPDYIDPAEPSFKLERTNNHKYETVRDIEVQNMPMARGSGVPVDNAVITVLETGRTVKVDPVAGRFNMRSPMGEYTLRAEAYGYYSQEAIVVVEEDQIATHNFILEQKPKGTITGRIFDRYYGDSAANAIIRVVEDGNIKPVIADENGNFTIENVYAGNYTLKVIADGFEPGEATIDVFGDEITNIEIGLKRFVGYEDEISYDNDLPVNALVINGANNGLAVRFTPAEYGKVVGANIYFWGNDWPTPGGTEIGIAIFDTDSNGNPSEIIGEPKIVNVNRGAWNLIDLSEFGFATDRDFFIGTMQTKAGDYSPGVGIDETSSAPERSYLHIGGSEFVPIGDENVKGGLMIRARVENIVDTPVISNLEELSYTNQDSITVEGRVSADGQVNVYVNNEKTVSVESENGTFTAEIELPLEENTIMVTAELDGVETEPSVPVKIIKDKEAPVLVVNEPADNIKIKSELVHIKGKGTDNIKLSQVLINDIEVELDEEGNFHKKLMVNLGENIITVKAIDGAGNETIVERTVYVELEAPIISNIEPSEDVELRLGEVLTVSFEAPAGGEGYFRLILPLGLQSDKIGIPMIEEDGTYTGTWTVPRETFAEELSIEVVYISEFGFEVVERAAGIVRIIDGDEDEVGNMEDLPMNSMIIDDEAFHNGYLKISSYAQRKLSEAVKLGTPIYMKISETQILDNRGNPVDINVFPDTIRYYDIDGTVRIYVK